MTYKIVRELVEPGTEVHTDEFAGYYNLSDGYVHKVINHLEGYVKGFNNRATRDNPLNDSDTFDAAIRQIVGRRITYQNSPVKPGNSAWFSKLRLKRGPKPKS